MSIFVHRFNLLFLFGFINCRIQCVLRLCYCCCPLAVCVDQLWLILSGVDWTLQMSAYNLLIPFISVCCCWCMCVFAWVHVLERTQGRIFQRQMGMGGVYVLEMSRSHLHCFPHPEEERVREGASSVGCLPVSFLFCSLSVFLPYACGILSLLLSF